MAILHKLLLALRPLDPHNHRWATLQKERALAQLQEISDTFPRYKDSDFGHKQLRSFIPPGHRATTQP